METWRPVVGYEALYEVSTHGRVRSLPRQVKHYTGRLLWRKGRYLAGCTQLGYRIVTLCKEGRYSAHRVHKIVAAAFIGPRPPGHVICHCDGNRLNNSPENLRYDVPQGNSDDMKVHGTVLQGERHGSAKLTEDQVRAIRKLGGALTQAEIATTFSISEAQVWNIVHRHQWKHI